MMHKDIRDTPAYREAEAIFTTLRQPGSGQISDASEPNVSPRGDQVAFSATLVDRLDGSPPTRLCLADLGTGNTRVISFGPNTDRLPKFSPDGRFIAFLSDRHEAGDFQLYLLEVATGAAHPAPFVRGWVEHLQWSPDGSRLLLGVAGHGADVSGGQGSIASRRTADKLPAWSPTVESGDENHRWRSLWVYEVAAREVRPASPSGLNVWESAWCGNSAVVSVASSGPSEGQWYDARLHLIDVAMGTSRILHEPKDQIGWPSASPSGRHVAIVEALCSDRWLVAGDLLLIDSESSRVRRVDTSRVDVTYTEWRSDGRLLIAGHRDLDTVVGVVDADTGTFTETWQSADITTGGIYVTVAGMGLDGDCALVGEGFARAPEIGAIRRGEYRTVRSFDLGYREQMKVAEAIEAIRWKAPDGLEIQGWVLRPKGAGPHPLVMYVHGGPVWHVRPMWLGRGRSPSILMLLARGVALFFPNPRGSSGRGQEFARRVLGDMGGADAHDCLSGIDYLVERGIADPERLGVTGASYGGFMTSWLITQDSRFAAAVPISPVTNQVTQHLLSNIPRFVSLFLADTYTNPAGQYFQRSPVMHAHKARTPTLNICGALDRCTPPEEAVQFHAALVENGVRSVLVTYPQEGHGVRKLPAAIDCAARVVLWFEEHMPPRGAAV